MSTFPTGSLLQQLDDNGYSKYVMSPKPASFEPNLSAFILDAENGKICSYNPVDRLWSFHPNRKSPAETNAMDLRAQQLSEQEIAELCLFHQLGVHEFSPNTENE